MTFRLVSFCLGSTFSLRAFVLPNKQFTPLGSHHYGKHQPEPAEAGPEQEIIEYFVRPLPISLNQQEGQERENETCSCDIKTTYTTRFKCKIKNITQLTSSLHSFMKLTELRSGHKIPDKVALNSFKLALNQDNVCHNLSRALKRALLIWKLYIIQNT